MLETGGDLPQAADQPQAPVLVADDDRAVRLVLREGLKAHGFRVEEAADTEAALFALRTGRHGAALVDILMPGGGGLDLLSMLHAEGNSTPIIVITAASTMDNAVEAMKRGAFDYLTKPFSSLETVVNAVERAVRAAAQAREASGPQRAAPGRPEGDLVGRSPAMQAVYKLIGRVVNHDAPVLLRGETGTGKELVARAIHFKSPRGAAPFVALNCSAVPQGLFEGELFGHERGAFTGATERRPGKMELAQAGTLFLDEIGDLPLEVQPKLLRVLQEREFSRVGGSETLKLRARILAATNQDLEAMVAGRRMREDLYFRLRVVTIDLPPLRRRREDIVELAEHFLDKAVREMGLAPRVLSAQARARLVAYDWPGNVRELENCVLRAALLAPGNLIRPEDLPLGPLGPSARPSEAQAARLTLRQAVARRVAELAAEASGAEPRDLHERTIAEVERELIERALELAGGNQLRAARILGLNRNTLRRKIVDYRIEVLRPRPA